MAGDLECQEAGPSDITSHGPPPYHHMRNSVTHGTIATNAGTSFAATSGYHRVRTTMQRSMTERRPITRHRRNNLQYGDWCCILFVRLPCVFRFWPVFSLAPGSRPLAETKIGRLAMMQLSCHLVWAGMVPGVLYLLQLKQEATLRHQVLQRKSSRSICLSNTAIAHSLTAVEPKNR